MSTAKEKTDHAAASLHVLSRSVILLLALCSGLSVATIYYAQPLLESIAREFGASPSTIGVVVTVTQVCYAAGLLLLVPLGDLLNKRRLIVMQMLCSAVALIGVSISSNMTTLLVGIAVVGLLAVVAQTMVAAAAAFSTAAERGRTVGLVTSGIVIGILLARTVAGALNDWMSWRTVYVVSAGLTLLGGLALFLLLPKSEPRRDEGLSYKHMLLSIFQLYRDLPVLRIRSLLAMLIFTCFSILWTSMVLPLSAPPLSLSYTGIGMFGLAGAAGAFAAARAGRWADAGFGQRTTGISLLVLLLAWLPIGLVYRSTVYLVIGVILLDLAVQAIHVTNQSVIYKERPEAQSRLTAAYMIFYSIGSATGSIASTQMYAWAGWAGVCWLGAFVSGLALLLWGYEMYWGRKTAPSAGSYSGGQQLQ